MTPRMIMSGFDSVFEYNHPNKVSKWLRGCDYRFSRMVDVPSAVVMLIAADKRTYAELLLIDYLKGAYIDSFMESTRKNWGPGGHEGSQSEDHDVYRTLISAITNSLDKEKAKWDSENNAD
jgi:hypothetical protein